MDPDEMPPWLDEESPQPIDLTGGPPANEPDHLAHAALDMVHTRYSSYPKKSKRNIALILELDRRWKDEIRLNLFDGQVYIRGAAVDDTSETEIAIWIDRHYGIDASTVMVSEIVRLIATRHSYHPIRDYMAGLEWDGTERVKHLLRDFFGADDTPLNRVLARCFLVSCVARVMVPGCKVDTVLILKGLQGKGKSEGFRALASDDWFSDSAIEMGHKDGYGALNGVWIYEFGELDSLNRKEAATAKAFLSGRTDRYRPSYGRNFITQKRQTVIVGTTNEETFLKDATGSRRYWPVEVHDPDVEGIEKARDQLWAEALQLYKEGWTWWLWETQADELRAASEVWRDVDVWDSEVRRWCQGRVFVTVFEVLDQAIKMPADRMSKGAQMRVAKVLQAAGWRKCRQGIDRVSGWEPPE